MKHNKLSKRRRLLGAVFLFLALELAPALPWAQEQSSPPEEEALPLPGLEELLPPDASPAPGAPRRRRPPRAERQRPRRRPSRTDSPARRERAAERIRKGDLGAENCWACHRLPNLQTDTGNQEVIYSCLNCHRNADNLGKLTGSKGFSLEVDQQDYRASTHSRVACISCHDQVARLPHTQIEKLACVSCHRGFACPVEGEAHPGMECALCHVPGNVIKVSGYNDPLTGRFVAFPRLKVQVDEANYEQAHNFTVSKPCSTCHRLDSPLGAPFPRLFTLAPWLAAASLLGLLGLLLRIQRSLRQKATDPTLGPWTTLAKGLRRITLGPGERDFGRILFADLIFCRPYLREDFLRGLAMILFTLPFLAVFLVQVLKAWAAALGLGGGGIVSLTHHPFPMVLDWMLALTGLALAGLILSLLRPKRPEKNFTAATPADQPWAAAAILFFLLGTLYSLLHPMPTTSPLPALLGVGWYLAKLGTFLTFLLVPGAAAFLGDWVEPLTERITRVERPE